ncbi:DUF11 domain-containing protein [Isoalcanivorax indicus]|uniref:DUF11 domain-containing protein n=1 Tax=Isoalcanivorax indicus TaxID=2202653 RepID=UPI000DBACD02|nr:DUF11 domain-containing protein [Isoalcanivorax indicus]
MTSIRTIVVLIMLCLPSLVLATPISLHSSYAGNVDFVVTGGTMRTQPNNVNACSVTNGPVSSPLSGIPAGASIRAAYLYWGGSGPTVDTNVTFDGQNISADRTFTENFNSDGFNMWFFGGMADVSSIVNAKRNGSYSFANLTVTTTDQGGGATYCSSQTVLAGWGLIVVFEHPAQDFRIVNIFDGLQWFRGNAITLTPSNFVVPPSPINGKLAVLTWEGDVENSAPLNGFSENLTINGTPLTGPLNPLNNQFNNTINVLNRSDAWGVDLDVYNISPYLSAGNTSATTVYSSGADLVLLGMQAISVTNVPTSDLAIEKRRLGGLQAGGTGQYRILVSNNGPSVEPGAITVTDTLDNRLSYTGFTGSGWSCGATAQNVTCTHPGPLAVNATLPELRLSVNVQAGAAGSGDQTVSNTASVSGTSFDNQSANNSSTTIDPIYGAVSGVKNLYPYFSGGGGPFLSRVVPGANTAVTLAGSSSITLPMAPAFVRPFTVTGNSMPVRLCIRRTGSTLSGRSMRVGLASVGTTPANLGSATLSTVPTGWTLATLNVSFNGPVTLQPGSQIQVTIENTTGAANRQIEVSSTQCGASGPSRIEMNSSTVIHVESISLYSAAFPSDAEITQPQQGQTVFVRARISDPFGSFDITSTLIDVLDINNNVILPTTAMTLVQDLTESGERIYQFSGAAPDWTAGPYTLRVRANEGTEGTVFALGTRLMAVSPQPPALRLNRNVSVAGGPPGTSVNASPGDPLTYSIVLGNDGAGDATQVVLEERLDRYVSLNLNGFGAAQPFEFTQGTVPSGLSPGQISYSSNQGISFDYVPMSGAGGAPAGFDSQVTHFRIEFNGAMPPQGTLQLRYRAIVD